MKAGRGSPLALIAFLAACVSESAPSDDNSAAPADLTATEPASTTSTAAPAGQPTPVLAIEGEGLRLLNPKTGAARPIPFGTARQAVLAALAFRGAPAATGTLEECGAGPLDQASWSGGLTLYFQDGKFAGWALGGDTKSTLATASGIGVGSTRAELEGAYEAKVFESTLGTEFEAGDLFGILDGQAAGAKVTHFWAGTSCNMR